MMICAPRPCFVSLDSYRLSCVCVCFPSRQAVPVRGKSSAYDSPTISGVTNSLLTEDGSKGQEGTVIHVTSCNMDNYMSLFLTAVVHWIRSPPCLNHCSESERLFWSYGSRLHVCLFWFAPCFWRPEQIHTCPVLPMLDRRCPTTAGLD